ncbi:MAG TPA: K(+)-transporting ATPase subunit F [Polyangiales bacterium]
MEALMWLGAGLSLALLFYLFFALLYPERLS